ncbi:MAG TPA: class I tRNA ligase family protein, partial [Candidatus Acidoferrales bacterium]|nr:class I tRNA ligase family protein [Candidatus Acidoferrales bacterium]
DSQLWEMDAWMLRRTGALIRRCREWYDNFEFHRVYHAIDDFCTVDLSAFYFDVLKDRLYTFAPKNLGRRSGQTALYRIANALIRLIAPTLVFTSEEVWKFLPRTLGDPESVHMTLFPEPQPFESAVDEKRSGNWDRLLDVRNEVLKALEPLRAAKTISANLEARVTLRASGKLAAILREYAAQLPAMFIVSQVELAPSDGNGAAAGGAESLQIEAGRALGKKCDRCWNYSVHVGENPKYPTVCERCVVALDEIERQGGIL